MIPKISASTVYSILGNNNSLIPLGIKDVANSCGLTTASYLAGDKVEGKDRFIDEFGTQAIWLGGIPAYKKILDFAMYKPMKLDSKIDVRIFKNPKIFKLAQELAPTQEIKNSLVNAAKNQKILKKLTIAKFGISTALTALTYLGLTKFRHKYTEKQIKKDYFERIKQEQEITFLQNKNMQEVPFSSAFAKVHPVNDKKQNNKVSFTGGFQDFIFNPVKNLMLVDGTITSERLMHARNPQDLMGYAIKEGSFWAFMYFAGQFISDKIEQFIDKKHNKSISLDARVIESQELKDAFKNGSVAKHIQEFKKSAKTDSSMYKFAITNGSENLAVKMAKKSDIIEVLKDTDMVDTRRFIDLKSLKGVNDKIEKLYKQYQQSGQNTDQFFKSLRKLKRGAVLANIGSCILALGVISPAIMLAVRKFDPEYQVKKDVEAKLAQEN